MSVDLVPEHEMTTRPPEEMFPGLDPAVWRRHAGAMAPDHWDPATGLLRSHVQTWVLRVGGETILVDTGIGNDKRRPGLAAFDHLRTDFLGRLRACGVAPEDVTVVINTHLHADHVGWNTRRDNGEWVPTFPNATYLVSRRDYRFWHPDSTGRPRLAAANENVFTDSVLPVERAGQLTLWEDAHQVTGELRLEPAPGHTPGSAVLVVASGTDRAVFVGDVLHNPIQIHEPDLNSCFCEDPVAARASRARVLGWAAARRAVVFPAHFAAAAVEVEQAGATFAVTRWESVP